MIRFTHTETKKRLAPFIGILFAGFLLSCVSSEPCDEQAQKALDGLEKKELQPLKDYLQNGGDPLYTCTSTYNSGGHYGSTPIIVKLSDRVKYTLSYEIVSYYLTFNIPSEIKNDMLDLYAVKGNDPSGKLVPLLIGKGAHVTTSGDCCTGESCIAYLKTLKKHHYDFNYVDSFGNNLLMEYAACNADSSDEVIKVLKFLKEQGAQTNLTNQAGETLWTIATDPKVKDYLNTIR
jgi:hypothetical protein